ncbi:hypothetical protein [Dyella sp.]|uniref:hypothetical protein n=1 Tax=Dyella sp. TaxID=1869338 RepID=UPI003F820C77
MNWMPAFAGMTSKTVRHRESGYCVAPAAALYRSPLVAALRRTQETLAKIEAAQQQFPGQA